MGLCLVTGASGYVGSRLVPRLLAAGHRVRCLSRSARRFQGVPWAGRTEIAEGDLLDPAAVEAAVTGVDVAYYLVHSLGSSSFAETDRKAAAQFAAAAAAAGVRRIVYLGGPVPPSGPASAHLRSRAEVGEILAGSGVPTVTLRAAVIIGSGSASFEMLRYLTERLPAMVTPRWVRTRIQPIAIGDVLRYLLAWAEIPDVVHRGFDIAGPDILTYQQMVARYAAIAGLPRRLIVPVRPLTPWLSALWVGLVTPVPSGIARPLVDSLVHDAVAHEHDIARYVPDPPGGLTGFDDAVRQALAKASGAYVDPHWTETAWRAEPADAIPTDPPWAGGSGYVDGRSLGVAAPIEALWSVIDDLAAGAGRRLLRRADPAREDPGRADQGRVDPGRVDPGHTADRPAPRWDPWVVEEASRGLLRLRARVWLPGRGWFELRAVVDGPRCRYEQRAIFVPKGFTGHVVWQVSWPLRRVALGMVATNVAGAAERRHRASHAANRQPARAVGTDREVVSVRSLGGARTEPR